MSKKRIPTIVGLLLLVVAAIAGVVFVGSDTDFLPRAAPEYVPQKVKITNISDNAFTISWVTQEPTIGFIKFGSSEDEINTLVVDDRDQLTGDSSDYRTHYVSVLGLDPTTSYYVKLGSQGKRLYDENGQPIIVTTGPNIGVPPPADTAYGTVVTPAETPAEGAIVYLNFGDGINATPLSALVKQNGSWAISLSTARTNDLSSYIKYDVDNSRLQILARSSLSDDATALTNTGNDQPVPTIVLGQSHDFAYTENSSPPPSSDETTVTQPASPSADLESKFSLIPIIITETGKEEISIDSPAKDGSVLLNAKPDISGTAPPGVVLTVIVHSDQIFTGSVNVDETGSWNWTPPSNLEPGEHEVTLSYYDPDGVIHAITRKFVVQAAESSADEFESPTYTATPSATPYATPTQSATPVPTGVPTLAPTRTPSPTPASISATPVAGVTTPTYLLSITGLILILAGFWITKPIFITREDS